MPADLLTVNRLLEIFSPIITNKSKVCGDITFNIVRHCFGIIQEPSKHVLEISSKS